MVKQKSRKLSPEKITKIFAGAAVLTLLEGGGLIFWLNGRISAEQTTQTAMQAQVGSSEKIAKRLQATQSDYAQAQSKIAQLEPTVSQNNYVPTLLQQIQTLAGQTNLTVTTLHPGMVTTPAAPAAPAKTDASDSDADSAPKKKAAPPPYSTMDVDLGITGTYADTARFLYGLTQFPKVLSVISVNMSPGQSGPNGAPPQVTTSLKLTAYIFTDDTDNDNAAPDPRGGTATQTATVVPPAAAPTIGGAAGRAAQGAISATQAVNGRATNAARVL